VEGLPGQALAGCHTVAGAMQGPARHKRHGEQRKGRHDRGFGRPVRASAWAASRHAEWRAP
jgi:hypothetical protein